MSTYVTGITYYFVFVGHIGFIKQKKKKKAWTNKRFYIGIKTNIKLLLKIFCQQ